MTYTLHLPAAVDHTTVTLMSVATDRLVAMQAECIAWRENMAEFRAVLKTSAGHILWNALCAIEVATVIEAHARVEDELRNRTSGRRTIAA